jgi:cytoskeletal protein CcmA (bactofilin family)
LAYPERTVLEVNRKPSRQSQGATAVARAPDTSTRSPEIREFQAKIPVITGEVHFKGIVPVDGSLSGQIGSGSCLNLKQRPSASFATQPELSGEITFKDMVRVNGHVAGTIYSRNGTLIVDANARVDANVDVAAAVIGGTVKGDIVARERVELGPASRISGNIWTRSLVIKDGAIFEGVCRMIEEEKAS